MMVVMAFDALDLEIDASPHSASGPSSTPPATAPGPGVRSWIASILGFRWRAGAPAESPSSKPSTDPWWRAVPAGGLPESLAALRVADPPAQLSMPGLLTAWRVAERALGELPQGSPEWAAVNATIISLRASYLARFDEYIAGSSS